MSDPTKSRVFISYSRKDASDLAQRLFADLQTQGLDPWLDTRSLRGGSCWTPEIEKEIDRCDVLLALLTQGSYVSEICRAEQLRALRLGKRVIPLRAASETDIPLHFEGTHRRDFTEGDYAARFGELMGDIASEKSAELRPEYRRTRYDTVPPLPPGYVERAHELAALRAALMAETGARNIAVTAVEGMGGIGKSVLAQALCRDRVVQDAFPDGIVWITVGRESISDVVMKMREVAKGLDDDLSRYDTPDGCRSQYRTTIRQKAALIVVDDVWSAYDLEPFRAESSRSRLLFTTRNANIAGTINAREHLVHLLDEQQCRQVLGTGSNTPVNDLPGEAADLIQECGRLPLALSMVAAMLRGKTPSAWARVLSQLRNADLAKIRADFPHYPHSDLLRAIQISVNTLDDEERRRYLALAVLLEEMIAHPSILRILWKVDEGVAEDIASRFVDRSLAQHDSGGIRLHDLQLDYVRAQHPDKQALSLIHEATRLSAHVFAKDPTQYAAQLLGRLLPWREQVSVRTFRESLIAGAGRPLFRLTTPTLHAPGTPLIRTLEGHPLPVNAVVFSPDGSRALSASEDRTLRLWDLESGTVLRTLKDSSRVSDAVFTIDGRRAISASSDDKTLKLWDLESGAVLRTFESCSWGAKDVALTPDGRQFVSTSGHTLELWDLESGRKVRTTQEDFEITAAGVTFDGIAIFAIAGQTKGDWTFEINQLRYWDLQSGRVGLVCSLGTWSDSDYFARVCKLVVSQDGRRCLCVSLSGTLTLCDPYSSKVEHTLAAGHSGFVYSAPVYAVALSPDGRRAVSGSADKTLNLWDLESGKVVRTLRGHSDAIRAVAVSPDGRRALSASDDGTLRLWHLNTDPEFYVPSGHSDTVNSVAVSPDGHRALSASDDGTLKLWDLASGVLLRTLEEQLEFDNFHDDVWGIKAVVFSSDGRRAFTDGLTLWDLDSGEILRSLGGRSGGVSAKALSPDGRRAASGSENKLKLWDLETGAVLRTLWGHSDAVYAVALSADGRRALTASRDKTLKLWDLDSGLVLRTLQESSVPIDSMAFSPDGSRAISASQHRDDTIRRRIGSSDLVEDKMLKLWNLDSGALLQTFEGHSDSVHCVALCPDGHRAISVSADKTLKVWNLNSGRAIVTFTFDAAAKCCATVANVVVVGDAAGNVHVLRLEEKPAPVANTRAIFEESQPEEISGGVVKPLSRSLLKEPFGTASPSIQSRVRSDLLARLESEWVNGPLRRGLRNAIRLELRLTGTISAVSAKLSIDGITESGAPDEPMTNYDIADVFNASNRSLLILGEPGTGKTNLLMELAESLIAEARRDQTAPVPLIFNLARWALGDRERSLADWLIDEISDIAHYGLSRATAEALVSQNRIALLFDGLDEVAEKHRTKCVEAIHAFQRGRDPVQMAICCRLAEYASVPKLMLRSAVLLEKMTRAEVARCVSLESMGRVRRMLQGDPELLNVIDAPLWLHLATLAAQDEESSAHKKNSARNRLYAGFVRYVLSREVDDSSRRRTPKTELLRYLGWLAQEMKWRNENQFFLEQLDYSWLSPEGQGGVPRGLAHGMPAGLVVGALGGIFGTVIGALSRGVSGALLGGVLGTLVSALSGSGLSRNGGGLIVEELRVDWKEWRFTLIAGLLTGTVVGVIFGLTAGQTVGEVLGVAVLLAGGVSGILRPQPAGERPSPNYGTLRSLQYAVITLLTGTTLGGGMVLAIPSVDLRFVAMSLIINMMVILALRKGGQFAADHYTARFLLWRSGVAPLRYVRFLNEAVERLFLVRRGGGYEFFHVTFRDYMADAHESAQREQDGGSL